MVKEIDEYDKRMKEKNKEREEFEVFLGIVSRKFMQPQYKLSFCYESLMHEIGVYFMPPNRYAEKYESLLHETDSSNTAKYNSIVGKVNLFNGFYPAASIHPSIYSINIHCPELYLNAKSIAKELEKKLKKEIILRTHYPRTK